MRFLLSVNEDVGLQFASLTKRFVALRAVVLLNSVMGLLMVPKATTAGKSLWALVSGHTTLDPSSSEVRTFSSPSWLITEH